MFLSTKKINFISLSAIIISAVFIFPSNINLAEAGDLPVIDQTHIDVSNKIVELLSGEAQGKGAEYYRLQAAAKLPEEKTLLKKVIESIIKMITTGDNGNPFYVTNVLQYLASTTASTINDFIKDPALDSVCDPFKNQIKQSAGNIDPTLKKQIQCTTDSSKLNDFNNGDFVNSGGWDTWNQVYTAPQNNYIGAQTIALTEEQNRIADKQEAAKLEATWGNGFTSIKTCDPSKANPDTGYDGCDIKTPGEVIANKLNSADISNVEQMQTATDYNEITQILAKQTEYSDPGSLSKPNGLQQEDTSQAENTDTTNGDSSNSGDGTSGGSSGGSSGSNGSGSSGGNTGSNGSSGSSGNNGTSGSN